MLTSFLLVFKDFSVLPLIWAKLLYSDVKMLNSNNVLTANLKFRAELGFMLDIYIEVSSCFLIDQLSSVIFMVFNF